MSTILRLRTTAFAATSLFLSACGGGDTANETPDTTAPDTIITSSPALKTNSAESEFTFSSSEENSSFEASLDGAAFSVVTSPYIISALSEGEHVLELRAIDSAGNIDDSAASYSWTIDMTSPDTNITVFPPKLSTSNNAVFEFSSSETNSTFEVSLDEGAFTQVESPYQVMGLSDGSHSIAIRAIDEVGNKDETINSYSWSVSTQIQVSACSTASGDNTPILNGDGTVSTAFIRSHTVGSPLYRIVNTRQLADKQPVSMDYMVHEPTGTPKGIMLLIAGGGLNSRIEGPADGELATRSSGNFVVRSAHRYQAAGYRVITIDRPSDFSTYGPFNVNFDSYRNSMQHATDIATILKRENIESLNVFIIGTSRGGISAAAMNTLAAGISMSSPVTSGATGHPVGSATLTLESIVRPANVLLHNNDTCFVTLSEDSRKLFSGLLALDKIANASEVTGGFQDTVRNDVCGAFDFHGFNGIETCAVATETDWADGRLTVLTGNTPPVADSQNFNQGDVITLAATDTDVDLLSYAVPFSKTSLGGTVITTAAGAVTYTPPESVTGVIDTFAFTVTDGKGGVGTAVISINLN